MLRIYSINLAISGTLGEQGLEKKLPKAVESSLQVLRGDIEEIIGMIVRGVRIATTSMLTQEFAVFILIWVLFRSEKEHVLAEMSQSGEFGRVRQMANVDVQSGGRFVRRWIGDQEHCKKKVVFEFNGSARNRCLNFC